MLKLWKNSSSQWEIKRIQIIQNTVLTGGTTSQLKALKLPAELIITK